MDLHIATHEFMKQMYMLEFSLQEAEMIRGLKAKQNEMEEVLERLALKLAYLSKPIKNRQNAFIPSVCTYDVLD